jgi:hypothetical protein
MKSLKEKRALGRGAASDLASDQHNLAEVVQSATPRKMLGGGDKHDNVC